MKGKQFSTSFFWAFKFTLFSMLNSCLFLTDCVNTEQWTLKRTNKTIFQKRKSLIFILCLARRRFHKAILLSLAILSLSLPLSPVVVLVFLLLWCWIYFLLLLITICTSVTHTIFCDTIKIQLWAPVAFSRDSNSKYTIPNNKRHVCLCLLVFVYLYKSIFSTFGSLSLSRYLTLCTSIYSIAMGPRHICIIINKSAI